MKDFNQEKTGLPKRHSSPSSLDIPYQSHNLRGEPFTLSDEDANEHVIDDQDIPLQRE